jgi:uncharacterized membrane protein HdeD (DUF308 family)
MLEMMARYWWVLLLRGLAAITLGVLAFVWPGITLQVLVLFFGAYALVDGLFMLVAAIGGRRHSEHWGLLLLQGLLGIAIGVLTAIAPAVTAFALVLYIAAWALATGVMEIVAAIRLRREIEGELWLALGGVLSIGFGLLVLAFPLAGALSLIWAFGAYAVAFGISLVILGLRLRGKSSVDLGGFAGPAVPAT